MDMVAVDLVAVLQVDCRLEFNTTSLCYLVVVLVLWSQGLSFIVCYFLKVQ